MMPDCAYCGKEMEFKVICNIPKARGFYECSCGSRSRHVEHEYNGKYDREVMRKEAAIAASHRHFEIDYNRADAWVEKLLGEIEELVGPADSFFEMRERYNDGEQP